MRNGSRFIAIILFLTVLIGNRANPVASRPVRPPASQPRVFLINATQLAVTRQRAQAGDGSLTAALEALTRDAQRALKGGVYSVVDKQVQPPSGDKHDYLSQAPYFWPDPKSPNGLPYIRRDGERNPEINKITDHQSLDRMHSAVEATALAYYFSGDEAYAARAAQLLRAFFLDAATRMNPNLEYAQFVPGVNTGRGIGLIETRGLAQVVDAVGLLAGAKAWTAADQDGMQKWFSDFLRWMQESKNGRQEAQSKNNHGTYYDVQIVSYALFAGQKDLALRTLSEARQKRIALQVEADGRQPLELARTKAWSYSVMNLDGLITLATLAANNGGVDLWNYQTTDGRSIRRALEFLVPVALGDRKWDYPELGGLHSQDSLFPLMRRAAIPYQDQQYQAEVAKVPPLPVTDRMTLLGFKPSVK
jgi:hypothetical protein